MSVLVNFAMFPTDKGTSMSPYVARIEKAIQSMGFPSQLGPMSTVVETPTLTDALEVINTAYKALANDCHRIYLTATFDIKEGKDNRMLQKVASVKDKLRQL